MKNILGFIVTSCLCLLYSCISDKKDCENFIEIPIDTEVKKYFDVYSQVGDTKIFTSDVLSDTLFIKSFQEGVTPISNFKGTCDNQHGKAIIFKGKNFIDTSVYLSISADREGTSLRCSDSTDKRFFFVLGFNRVNNAFNVGDESRKMLDSIKATNTTYFKVLEIKNIVENVAFYFAPNKGLVRWKNKNKIYDLKN